MSLMALAEFDTREIAERQSRALMRAIARRNRWRWVDGMGVPPGNQVGPGPRNLPGQGYATHWQPVLEASVRGKVYLRVDSEMERLAVGSIERIDGKDVELVRTGVELDPDVVLKS